MAEYYCGQCGKRCNVREERSGVINPLKMVLDPHDDVILSSYCCDAEVYTDSMLQNMLDDALWDADKLAYLLDKHHDERTGR